MWHSFKEFWVDLVRIEKKAEAFAKHEAELVAHAAGAAMHKAEDAVHKTEKAAAKGAKGIYVLAREFLRLESSAGILLMIAATIAIIIANTPLYGLYDHILHGINFRIGFDDHEGGFDFELKKSLLHWVNDGLMVVFFFLIGLEIKREIMDGELSTRARALLPALAAVGGMAVPALIYWYINQDSPETIRGWAIPAATDIAFALGVLSLLGSRVPLRLKILLTAIAVIDDLGAILVIAIFYSDNIIVEPLYVAGLALIGLLILNRKGVTNFVPYMILGVVLWVTVLESGIHATLAGVIAAFFIPHKCKQDPDYSPCRDLEHDLHPWVAFVILPLFAFANAGVPFSGMGLHSLLEPVTLGIILGLVLGKPLGIFTVLVLAIKTGLSPMPQNVTWLQLYAVSILCGIGFTMSLFIGGLAFESLEYQAEVRLGILVGSVVAALAAVVILFFAPQPQNDVNKSEGLNS